MMRSDPWGSRPGFDVRGGGGWVVGARRGEACAGGGVEFVVVGAVRGGRAWSSR